MTPEELKQNREIMHESLKKLFICATEGMKFIRLKFPVGDKKYTCIIGQDELETIFQFLKRGVNRGCKETGEPMPFTKLNDLPDPEEEFDRQMFTVQAELLDSIKGVKDAKEIGAAVTTISKINESRKSKTNIRKVDLKLLLALARHLDPTISDQKVIEILKFESEKMGLR